MLNLGGVQSNFGTIQVDQPRAISEGINSSMRNTIEPPEIEHHIKK